MRPVNHLISWLRFDTSTTADLCGNTWYAPYNEPTLLNGKLLFNHEPDDEGCLDVRDLTFRGGQDFTVDAVICMDALTPDWASVFTVYVPFAGNVIRLEVDPDNTSCLQISHNVDAGANTDGTSDYSMIFTPVPVSIAGREVHIELDYRHSAGVLTLYIDGVRAAQTNCPQYTVDNYNFALCDGFLGTIDEFRIFNGIALHTDNFTPPTAEDYAADFAAVSARQTIQLTADVSRRVIKPATVVVDVQREVLNHNINLINVSLNLDVKRTVKKIGNYLKAWLRFTNSPTEDICGNTWTTYGNPTIGTAHAFNGKALQLDGQSYIKLSGIQLGGQDFYIDGWVYVDSSSPNYARVLHIVNPDTGTAMISVRKSSTNATRLDFWASSYAAVNQDSGYTYTSSINSVGERVHFKLIYRYSNKRLSFCINDVIAADWTTATQYTRRAFDIYIGALSNGNQGVIGSVDELRIYDGTWFSYNASKPPTWKEYIGNQLNATGTADVLLDCDVQRKVTNPLLTWRYENAGDADDLILTAPILTNLPATKSKTGTAFYQTTRAKCFNLPATSEVWIKFDVYFDGTNRWRAYNGDNNKTLHDSGISSLTSGELMFFIYNQLNQSFAGICKRNTLQTVLLHMKAGTSDGIIEAWVDGTFIYRYTGNVNHGDAFADIFLQSDGAGTFFSNVIISNAEIELDEDVRAIFRKEVNLSLAVQRKIIKRVIFSADVARGLIHSNLNEIFFTVDVTRHVESSCSFSVDVTRTLFASVLVPFIGEHFNHFIPQLQLFKGRVQPFILPKRGTVNFHAVGKGAIKVFSDTDADGVIVCGSLHYPANIDAELSDCQTLYVIPATIAVSPLQVIKAYMFSMTHPQTSDPTLDEAVNFASGGKFVDMYDLIERFLDDAKNADSYTDFLQEKCDIILDNDDTGAITGWDAGNGIIKTAQSVVTESTPVENWITPAPGSQTTINGLTVQFPTVGANGSLTNAENFILAGLNSEWIKRSLDLIYESYGISFSDEGVTVNTIGVVFNNDVDSDTLAYVTASVDRNTGETVMLTLTVNMRYFENVDVNGPDGTSPDTAPAFLDRVLVHELTHAVMAAHMAWWNAVPNFIKEGVAELVHGIDDTRRDEIIFLLQEGESGIWATKLFIKI